MYIPLLALALLFCWCKTISANVDSLASEILVFYYAYKIQASSNVQPWKLFYRTEGQPLKTFGEWASLILPPDYSKEAWLYQHDNGVIEFWEPAAADDTVNPTIHNTDRLVSYAPEKGTYEMDGMSRDWDDFVVKQAAAGQSKPGLTKLLDCIKISIGDIAARASRPVSTSDLVAMKTAIQSARTIRVQTNWPYLRAWLVKQNFLLAKYLPAEHAEYDEMAVSQAIQDDHSITGNAKASLKASVFGESARFGDRKYGRNNNIDWSRDYGGAEIHRGPITNMKLMVTYLQAKLNEATTVPDRPGCA